MDPHVYYADRLQYLRFWGRTWWVWSPNPTKELAAIISYCCVQRITEVEPLWQNKTETAPIVINALGKNTKYMEHYFKTIGINEISICQLQKAASLTTVYIMQQYP